MALRSALLLLAAAAQHRCGAAAAAAARVPAQTFIGADDACASPQGCGVELLQHGSAKAVGHAEGRARSALQQPGQRAAAPAGKLVPALVAEVYTYGAPATHSAPLRNAATLDGCFPGLRSYTEDLLGAWDEIHQVDAAAMNNYYPHSLTSSVCLHWGQDSYYTPCNKWNDGHPDWPQRGGQVYEEWRLHQEDDYRDRLDHVTVAGKFIAEEEPFLSARRFVTLAFKSYDTVVNAKAEIARDMPGWRLVARAVDVHGRDEDPVWLAQETKTLNCALTFTGTNDGGELSTSTTQYGTGYCGFENVHVGYRNELWTITGDTWDVLRPKLEQCNQVICVGHSLGGALCEIFAACANSGHISDPDYQRLGWVKKKPTLLPEYTE